MSEFRWISIGVGVDSPLGGTDRNHEMQIAQKHRIDVLIVFFC